MRHSPWGRFFMGREKSIRCALFKRIIRLKNASYRLRITLRRV